MTEKKKSLLDKAKLYLTDAEYNEVETLLEENAINKLRFFFSDLAYNCEIRHMINDVTIERWLAIDEMNDIVIDITIEKNEDEDKGIVESRKGATDRRFKIII